MERSEIIKKFLSEGFQLDSSALKFLLKNEDKIENILTRLKENKPKELVLSSEILQKFLEEAPTKIDIIPRNYSTKEMVSVEDITNFFVNRYSNIWNILSKRMELVNLISINKITQKIDKFSLIVMIRKIEGNKIFVEDLTGQLKLELRSNQNILLTEDEVIGVVCKRFNENFLVENVYYPDIPLKKEVLHTTEDINCFFIPIEKINEKKLNGVEKELEEKNNLFFLFLDSNSNKTFYEEIIPFFPKVRTFIISEEKIQKEMEGYNFLSDPAFVKVEELVLLLTNGKFLKYYSDVWKISLNQIVLNLIKKRHLNPSFKFSKKIFVSDPFFLDIVPDIVYVNYPSIFASLNYKGTTILVNGNAEESAIWKVNLKTRENIKIFL